MSEVVRFVLSQSTAQAMGMWTAERWGERETSTQQGVAVSLLKRRPY